MTKERYIGIENELTPFKDGRYTPFDTKLLQKLVTRNYFQDQHYKEAIISDSGNKYYIDGNVLEIATPPIPINNGFASRVSDQLIIGRNHIIQNTPDIEYTGYSMHWNLTIDNIRRRHTDEYKEYYNILDQIYNDLTVPFQLLGLTPLSCGSGIRGKEQTRLEILGDSIVNEDQINATALLLGAYSAARTSNRFPLKIKFPIEKKTCRMGGYLINHALTQGRHTQIQVAKKSLFWDRYVDTQAQNVFELFYEWLSPFIHKLGTNKEVSNLEAFVTGNKKLEMDEVKYFYMLNDRRSCFGGTYQPKTITTPEGAKSPILKIHSRPKLPLEGRLLRNLVTSKKINIDTVGWGNLATVNSEQKTYYVINGIRDKYIFMENFSKLKFIDSEDTSSLAPKRLVDKELNKKLGKISCYNPNKDDSAIISDEERFEIDVLRYYRHSSSSPTKTQRILKKLFSQI